MRCLGLDVGSSTIKGAVLDLERREVGAIAKADFPAPLSGLPAGWFEVQPSAIQSAVEGVLERLVEQAPDAAALYVSGQMGGTILVDQSGQALTNYLSWRDQRTQTALVNDEPLLISMRQSWNGRLLSDLGNELQAGSTSSLLFWLAQQGQLPAQAMPATVADYVIGRLCDVPPQMHATHAIGLLDLNTGHWHRTAFAALGLDGVCWPSLADLSQPVGYVVRNGHRIACHAAVGDQQCALRGAGLARGELSLNVSTGSQVSQRTATFEPGNCQSRMFFEGDCLNTITHLPAGRSLNVLVDLLTELARAEGIALKHPWETIARRAAEVGETSLQANLAFFAGPLGSTGSLEGITTENLSVGHVFHAAFRAMAENYAVCADRLNPSRPWERVILSGGLTQSVPILRQLIQDRLGLPLRESQVGEETLFGLLELATTGRSSC